MTFKMNMFDKENVPPNKNSFKAYSSITHYNNNTPTTTSTSTSTSTSAPTLDNDLKPVKQPIKAKVSWTRVEYIILKDKRALCGQNWELIATHLPGRQGKQCSNRYVNYIDSDLKKGQWTDYKESLLILLYERHGNQWSNIAKCMEGRSENDNCNHWMYAIQNNSINLGER